MRRLERLRTSPLWKFRRSAPIDSKDSCYVVLPVSPIDHATYQRGILFIKNSATSRRFHIATPNHSQQTSAEPVQWKYLENLLQHVH